MQRLTTALALLVGVLILPVASLAQDSRAHELVEALRAEVTSADAKGVRKAATENAKIRRILNELKVIYGSDDRKDYFEASANQRLAADSTVALVDTGDLEPSADETTYNLPDDPIGREKAWCEDEPFYHQPAPAFCSGFLVAPDRIATAGHCIEGDPGDDCGSVSFVFGFNYPDGANAEPARRIPADNVYRCKSIVDGEFRVADRSDWRVLTVDRAVTGRTPLNVRPADDSIPYGTELTVIGHPVGLPTKIADNAKLRDNGPSAYFVANLDTYGGNSGSAVFNSKSITGGSPLVEGILVRGEDDFEYDLQDRCYRSKKCADDGCRGEDVTRASEFVGAIGG